MAADKFIQEAKCQNSNIKEPFLPWYCMLTNIHRTGRRKKKIKNKINKQKDNFVYAAILLQVSGKITLSLIFQDANKTPPRPADTNVNLYQHVNSILFQASCRKQLNQHRASESVFSSKCFIWFSYVATSPAKLHLLLEPENSPTV